MGLFTRKPSNYTRVVSGARFPGAKNENVRPPKAATVARSAATVMAAQARARRSRVLSGQWATTQRIKQSKKRHDHKKSRGQSARTTQEPSQQASSSITTARPEVSVNDDNVEEEGASAMDISIHSVHADEDTPVFKGISLPRMLPRPALRPVSNQVLATLDPNLAGIPAAFISDLLQDMSPR